MTNKMKATAYKSQERKELGDEKTFGVSVLDTGPENDEMEISNQNTAIKFEEV